MFHGFWERLRELGSYFHVTIEYEFPGNNHLAVILETREYLHGISDEVYGVCRKSTFH